MTDTATPLPSQLDGEPDLAAEIVRLDAELKDLAKQNAELERATDLDGLLNSLDELLTPEARASIPKDASKMDQVFARITAALGEAKRRPVVPQTDTTTPSLTPVAPDLSALPAHARMARGYGAA